MKHDILALRNGIFGANQSTSPTTIRIAPMITSIFPSCGIITRQYRAVCFVGQVSHTIAPVPAPGSAAKIRLLLSPFTPYTLTLV